MQQDSDDLLKKYKTEQFIQLFEEAVILTELNIDLYFKLNEKMMVFSRERIIVTLLDGTEVECQIEIDK